MLIRFSQKNVSNEQKQRIRRLWKFVQTRSAKDLCVKVLITKEHLSKARRIYAKKNPEQYQRWVEQARRQYSGNFRNLWVHGFYEKERKELWHLHDITNIITLKIGIETSDENIIYLMAHEFKHYLQYRDNEKHKYKRYEKPAFEYGNKIRNKYAAMKEIP